MDVRCYVCIGGISVYEDIVVLKDKSKGVYFVVGIFGRVFDLINRSYLSKF